MSIQAIRSFEDFVWDNQDAFARALSEDFSPRAMVGFAKESGFNATDKEWERYLGDFIPHSQFSVRIANNDNEIVELEIGEVAAVNGGIATAVAAVNLIAVAIAFAAVLAQALAAAVNVAVAANIAWTVNKAWTSGLVEEIPIIDDGSMVIP